MQLCVFLALEVLTLGRDFSTYVKLIGKPVERDILLASAHPETIHNFVARDGPKPGDLFLNIKHRKVWLTQHHQKDLQDNVLSILTRGCLPVGIGKEAGSVAPVEICIKNIFAQRMILMVHTYS